MTHYVIDNQVKTQAELDQLLAQHRANRQTNIANTKSAYENALAQYGKDSDITKATLNAYNNALSVSENPTLYTDTIYSPSWDEVYSKHTDWYSITYGRFHIVKYVIYFLKKGDEEQRVSGEKLRDEYIQQGYSVEGSVADDIFLPYSPSPRGKWWDIVSGQFVPHYTVAQLQEYQNDMTARSEYKSELASMDYKTNKFIEGLMTEDEWNSVKAERNRLRVLINDIDDRWAINEKE